MIETVQAPSPETTELERRVLAHERILQSLIAFMSRSDPRFIDHLRKRFVEPMVMARREHDYIDVDDYAEEFIRAVMRIDDIQSAHMPGSGEAGPVSPREHDPDSRDARTRTGALDRVHLSQHNGIWQVTIDGAFHGDFRRHENALAAAALARLSLQ